MTAMRTMKAETMKYRHRRIFLIPLCFLGFLLVWSLWNLQPENALDLAQGHLYCFYYFPTINVILYPVFIGVLASRLCDMEIKGETLKLLYTLQERKTFYLCKYLSGLWYLFLTTLAEIAMILGIRELYHFSEKIPLHMLLQFGLTTFFVSAALLSVQQMLSLLSSNQILPLSAGLAGSFVGLFSLFFPKAVSRFVLWGYYGYFHFIHMDWNRETRISHYNELPFPWTEFIFFILFTIVLWLICRAITLRKEV